MYVAFRLLKDGNWIAVDHEPIPHAFAVNIHRPPDPGTLL